MQRSCDPAVNGFQTTNESILGPGGEQVTEYAVSGATSTWIHTNAFSGGKIQATYDGTDTTFYLGDWLGTKRVEVGASGCATAYASLPYGDGLTTVSLPGYNACASDATEHHFTGKERDNESGNDYFEARYYASSMGRFMSPDWSAKAEPVPYAKMDDPQSLNLYTYVRNNPLTRMDIDGHQEPDCGCQALPQLQMPQFQMPQLPTMNELKNDLRIGLLVVSLAASASFNSMTHNIFNKDTPAPTPVATPGTPATPIPTTGQINPTGPAQPTSNPWTGTPGSTSTTHAPDGTPKQVREYGPDGYPKTDVDYGHGHNGSPDPHAHDTGRPTDGSPPTNADRAPGRTVQPTDPKPQPPPKPQP
jgi:RHS repeat-associated protein